MIPNEYKKSDGKYRRIFDCLRHMKTIHISLLNGDKNTVLESLVLAVKIIDKLLHAFSFGMLVHRTGAFDHGQVVAADKIANIILVCINKGTNHGQILAR